MEVFKKLLQLWSPIHYYMWLLVIELECKFSNYELMNVFRVIYPQYWLQPFCDSTIVTHMNLIKPWATFKNILNLQISLFKLTMKIQTPKVMEKPRDDNLIIKMWHQLVTNNLLVVHFLNSWNLFEWSMLSKFLVM
jgi:hypothetical protein